MQTEREQAANATHAQILALRYIATCYEQARQDAETSEN